MKNLFLFLSFLLGSISLTGQLRLNVAGNAKIEGRLDLQSDGAVNLFIGNSTGLNNTDGENNIFIGPVAGFFNTTGSSNTIIGAGAGLLNTTGSFNTFLGDEAGRSNTADNSTFIGSKAGFSNTTGQLNTFVGEQAGYANNTGSTNTFIGSKAGAANTSGSSNNFIGRDAGLINTTGYSNTIIGTRAGFNNTTGNRSVFLGNQAGFTNTTGEFHTYLGLSAGFGNEGGTGNTFVGAWANANSSPNASELILIGFYASPSFTGNPPINNAFVIGNRGLINSSHSGTLGNLSTQKLTGYVNFGTASDGRMKKQIREDIHGLDFILALRPVSYQVDALKLDQFLRKGMEEISAGKKETLSTEEKAKARERQATYEGYLRKKSAIRYTGFIAQEVEKVMTESGFEFSGLVKPAHDQDHYSLRYAEFVVPLVKGMQEQQVIIEAQKQEVQRLQFTVQDQQEQIDELKNLVQQLLAQQPNQTSVQQLDLKQSATLFQNHPNPFHENTVIRYFLPEGTEHARLEVYSVDGKLLTTLPLTQSGEGQMQLKAGSFPAGTYLYSLVVGNEVLATKRMILTK